jgi:YVTN family beta-propeller protein
MNPTWRAGAQLKSFRAAILCCFMASAAVLLVCPVEARAQLAPPSSGLINPRAIVYSSTSGKIYAVDTGHHGVDIYTAGAGRPRRVTVGSEPVSIAVNNSNGKVYVANAGDGTISVLDPESNAVVATIPVGLHPYSIGADPTTGNVFVTHTFGDQISLIDGASNSVTQLDTGSADLIAIDSRTGTVYLLGYGGKVTVLDEATRKFTRRDVGKHAWGLTLDDTSGKVYVTRIEDADLAAITASSSEPVILPAGAIPCAIAVDAKSNLLFVANYGDNTVSEIDTEAGRVTATFAVGERPKAIAFDPILRRVYVANTGSNSVTVIDAAAGAVLATLPAGKSPYALAVVPGSRRLYVANESDEESSTVVDLSGLPAGKQ